MLRLGKRRTLHVVMRARQPPIGRCLRRGRLPCSGGGRCVVRLSRLHDGRAAGRERPRKPRSGPERHPQFRFRVSGASHHGQPRARGRAQGRCVIRPSDRARHSGGARYRRTAAHRGPGAARRALARRIDSSQRGVLPIAAAARRDGVSGILLPTSNASEASIVAGLDVFPVASLIEAVHILNDPASAPATRLPPRQVAKWRRGAGSRRRAWSAAREARARDRGGRRTQPAARRPTRRRQDDDGAAGRRNSAAAHLRRGAGGDDRALGCGASGGGRRPDRRRGRFAHRITRSRTRRSSAADRSRGPAK